MDFANCSNRAALDQFHDTSIIVTGMDLCPDLCDRFVFVRKFCDGARFRYSMSQRLFAINVPAASNHRCRSHSMRVIWSCHHDCIEISLVNQAAKIAIDLRSWKALRHTREAVGIYVTERDDILVFEVADAEAALARNANDANVELVVGRDSSPLRPSAAGKCQACHRAGADIEEVAP